MKPTSKPFCKYLLPNQSNVPWPDWISTRRSRSGSLFVQSPGWWAWGMTSTSSLVFPLRSPAYNSSSRGASWFGTRLRPGVSRKNTLWCPPSGDRDVHSKPRMVVNSPSIRYSSTSSCSFRHSLSSIQMSCSERLRKSSRATSRPNR